MKTRLYIEDNEIELTDDVKFSLNKQFETLSNPTTIINDWSKTVQIPMTQQNNKIFNNMFNPDRINGDGNGMFIHFDPLKKLDFRLEWSDSVIMTGYAKVNSVDKKKSGGSYNITLNGQLGKLFQEMKKITFDPEQADDAKYLIKGDDYVSATISKELVKDFWQYTGQKHTRIEDSDIKDIIGFAPNNSFDEKFDYKTFQTDNTTTHTFEETLGDSFKEDTGIDPSTAIGNGLLPRNIGEYRSYLQQPYIYFNKLFQIFQKKSEEITGYEFDLDEEWFSELNPYWYNLVYMLKKFDDKSNTTYTDSYGGSATEVTVPRNDSKNQGYDFSRTSDKLTFSVKNEQIPYLDSSKKKFKLDNLHIVDGVLSTNFKFSIISDGVSDKIVKIRGNCVFVVDFFASFGGTNKKIARVAIKNENTTYTPSETTHLFTTGSQYIPSSNYEWVLVNSNVSIDLGNMTQSTEELSFYYTVSGWFAESSIVKMSMLVYQGDGETPAIFLGPVNVSVKPETTVFNITKVKNRTGFNFTINDLWNHSYSIFDEIIKYCKMYRIIITADDYNKTIKFTPMYKYFSNYTIEDWTNKLDKSKDYTVTPITWDTKYVLLNYEDTKTLLGSEYKSKYAVNYGDFKIITNYNFNTETKKIFEKLVVPMSNTDNVLSWENLYTNHKIIYTLPAEISVYCKDKDNKYVDCFGQYFFFNGLKYWDTTPELNLRQVKLSDDTPLQQTTNTYFYSQSVNSINVTTYPYLDTFYQKNGGNYVCTFAVPREDYTYVSRGDSKGIYEILWRNYIKERYNPQNKKLTCYLHLLPQDYNKFEFNKFVTIENQLYFVNKIYDYDPSDVSTTKVDLLTISDIDGYKTINSDFSLPKEILLSDQYGGYISGNIDDDTYTHTYIKSYYDINFENGTKITTIGGVEFKIIPTSWTVSGVEYNYALQFRKVDKYNKLADSSYDVDIISEYSYATLTFTRYRDYPNPPVVLNIWDLTDNTIPTGTGNFTLNVRTQYPPESNITFTSVSGLELSANVEWEYHNDDYVFYSANVSYTNNHIGSEDTSTTVKITTGSGYQLSKTINVKATEDELVRAQSYAPYIIGDKDDYLCVQSLTYNYTYDWVSSKSDLLFANGTKSLTIGGLSMKIVSTDWTISGKKYNYKIVYEKTSTYNEDEDTSYTFTLKNNTKTLSCSFTRYRDYPNPPYLSTYGLTNDSLPAGSTTEVEFVVHSQLKPQSYKIELTNVPSSELTWTVTQAWSREDYDEWVYVMKLKFVNNHTYAALPKDPSTHNAKITITTGSGYTVSKTIKVIGTSKIVPIIKS